MVQRPRVNKRSLPGNPGRGPGSPSGTSGTSGGRTITFLDSALARSAGAAGIPLVLWVCAAVVAHLAGGGGAMEAAAIARDEAELRAAVRIARDGVHPPDTTIELISDEAEPTPQNIEPPKDDGTADSKSGDVDPDAPNPDPAVKPPPKPKEKEKEKKPDPPKVEPPKPPEPPKPKPELPKPLAPVAPAPAAPPPPPPPPMEADHRIAVRQHAKKDQPDNPTANRLAEDANHVDKETVARARSQDQDSPTPSLGAHAGGPSDGDPGDSKDDHSGSAEDHKGDEKHAPGEAKKAATDAEHEEPKPPAPPTGQDLPPPSMPGLQGKGGKGLAAASEAPPPSPGGAGPASPETISGDKGTYALDPVNPGGDGTTRRPGRKRPRTPYFQAPVHANQLGLGGTGLPGGPNLNLNQGSFQKAVGNEELARERAADGAARRAAHRGKWEKNKFDKWRPAIENYEPSVKLDNVTALNAARSPFATYLNTIHNRLHPIFAEEWLAFLDGLPKNSPLNDMTLVTNLEIVLDKDTGKIVRMGVTKPSGYTMYDVAALNAVDRAGPYGKAPDIIASPDGNVYLHWEFHRDPFDACTTRNARPFLLKTAPKKPGKPVGPVKKAPSATNPDDRSAPSGPLVPMR